MGNMFKRTLAAIIEDEPRFKDRIDVQAAGSAYLQHIRLMREKIEAGASSGATSAADAEGGLPADVTGDAECPVCKYEALDSKNHAPRKVPRIPVEQMQPHIALRDHADLFATDSAVQILEFAHLFRKD